MEYDYKSQEERQFADWLEVCMTYGLVKHWQYEPKSFVLIPAKTYTVVQQLKTKTKTVEKTLHQEASYTPDFMVEFTDEGLALFKGVFSDSYHTNGSKTLFIDTKGEFDRRQGDGRFFSLIRKLMYDKHGIWVEKVIPKRLFKETFAPETVRWMRNRKTATLTKVGSESKTVGDFLAGER